MPSFDGIRVNGNAYSWGSMYLRIGGEEFTGFTEITYGDKRTRVKGYGMGRHQAPRLRSRGKYETDPVKLKGPKGSIQALRAFLAQFSLNGISYGDVEFGIFVQFIESDEVPINVELRRCIWQSNNESAQESPDPLMDEIEVDTMAILRNGLTLFDSSEGAPT